jgi:hypothetical protein
MAEFRQGYFDDYSQQNGNVGIGTSISQEKLEIIGGTTSSELSVSGIATLTSASGFIEKRLQYTENVRIDQGDSGTLAGDIIVGTGETMTVGSGATAGQGIVDSMKVYQMFNPPSGTTNTRPAGKPGAIFYNFDFKTIEFFDGTQWRQVDSTTRGGRGVFGGGYGSPVQSNSITTDFVNIQTLGNAIHFGDLNDGGASKGSMGSNGWRGLFMGGYWPAGPSTTRQIDYITIQSQSNGIEFGDLTTTATWGAKGTSSSTRGIRMGGYPNTDVIDYVEIGTLGDAIDFGDLTYARHSVGALASPTKIFGGGGNAGNSYYSVIDTITTASTGNSIDGGDLGNPTSLLGAASNSVRGVWLGGRNKLAPSYTASFIQYRTLATSGVTQYFGELYQPTESTASTSTATRIVTGGGSDGSNRVNSIAYVTIASTGNALDFGDLIYSRSALGALSDSHGGLGGF